MKKIIALTVGTLLIVAAFTIAGIQLFAGNEEAVPTDGTPVFTTSVGDFHHVTFNDHILGGDAISIVGLVPWVTSMINTNLNIVIPESIDGLPVTRIDQNAFHALLNDFDPSLTIISTTIPNTIREIASGAFSWHSIQELIIPSSVRTIGTSAFAEGTLTSLVFEAGSNTLSIDSSAFVHNNLTNLNLAERVLNFNDTVFAFNNLTTVLLSSNVTQAPVNFSGNPSSLVFFTDLTSRPVGWHELWNFDFTTDNFYDVVWGTQLESTVTITNNTTTNFTDTTLPSPNGTTTQQVDPTDEVSFTIHNSESITWEDIIINGYDYNDFIWGNSWSNNGIQYVQAFLPNNLAELIMRTPQGVNSTEFIFRHISDDLVIELGQPVSTFDITTQINQVGTANSQTSTVSVTGGGLTGLETGHTRTITADPATGWRFVNWTITGTGSSVANVNNASTTFTMGTANTTITANFQHHEYLVTLNPAPGAGGTTSFTHRVGSTPENITPPTSTGRNFLGYYLGSTRIFNANGTSAVTNWVISGAQTLTASWEGNIGIAWEVVPSTAAGSIGITGGGASNLEPGDTRTITATANSGWRFTHWTIGAGSGGATIANSDLISTTLTLGTNIVVILAHFEHHTYTVTLDRTPGTGGTASFTHRVGTTPQNITPPLAVTGWRFLGYYLGTTRIFNDDGTPAVTNWVIDGAQTLTASWGGALNINTSVLPAGSGTVNVTGTTTNLESGTTRTITATAAPGWRFTHWTAATGTFGDIDDASTTFTIGTSTVTVTAHFEHHTYLVTLDPSPGTGGTLSFIHRVATTTPSTITPPTRTGWNFMGYYLGSTRIFNANGSPTVAANNWVISGPQTLTAAWEGALTISTAVDTIGSGSVSVGGNESLTNLEPGTVRTFTATAEPGYRFTHWSTTSGTIATSNSLTTNFTLSDTNATITAHFEHHTYLVTLNPAPGSGGTTSFTHRVGTTPDNIIIPTRTGWDFLGYYLGSVRIFNANGTPAVSDWIINGDQTLTASWGASWGITTQIDPDGEGAGSVAVTGGGTTNLEPGMTRTITATANPGWRFTGWTTTNGTIANSTDISTTFTVGTTNAVITAHFEYHTYTVTLNPAPGTGGTLSFTHRVGTTPENITTPTRAGWNFMGYYLGSTRIFNANGTPAVTNWVISGAETLTASWEGAVSISTEINPDGEGAGSASITGGGTTNIEPGMTRTITATANSGWRFTHWTSTSGTITNSTDISTTFTVGTTNATITAHFEHHTYTVTLNPAPGTGGTTSFTHRVGTTPSAIITPTRTGWNFVGYYLGLTRIFDEDGNATTAANNWVISGDQTLAASWEGALTISTAVDPSGSATISVGGNASLTNLEPSTTHTFTATAEIGYRFTHWTSTSGTIASPNSATTNFTIDDVNATLTAHFEHHTYLVTLNPAPGTGGTTSFTHRVGQTPSNITPPTREDWHFMGYYLGSTRIFNANGTPAVSDWIINGDQTLTAEWDASLNISTSINPAGAGSITVSENEVLTGLTPGDTRTFTATPELGWRFSHWTTTSGTIATENQATTLFTVGITSATLTAHFVHHEYLVTLNPSPGTGGTTSFTHRVGQTPSNITPPTRLNWDFVGYYLGSTRIFNADGTPTAAATNWVISGAQTLIAEWDEILSNITTEINETGAGSVNVTGTTTNLAPNTSRTITASANTGWRFTHWTTTSGTIINSTDISTTFTIGIVDAVITAHFEHHTYLVTLNPASGTGGTLSFTHRVGTTPSAITPPTRNGWNFMGYYLGSTRVFNANGTPAVTDWVITGTQTLTAAWEGALTITTQINEIGAGSIEVDGNESLTTLGPNTVRTFTATAEFGWRFTHWSTTSGVLATPNSLTTTFTLGDVNATVTAHFEHHTYLVTLNPAPGSGGTTSFTHRVGQTPTTITPPVHVGWNFLGYYLGSTRIFDENGNPTAAATNWVISGAQTLTASWEGMLTISTQINETGAGSISVTGNESLIDLEPNTIRTFTATPELGWRFTHWTTSSGTLGTPNALTTTLTLSDVSATITAHFEHHTYLVTLNPAPGSGGTLSFTHRVGQTPANITVPTRTGWNFLGYYLGSTRIFNANGTPAVTNWTISGAQTLTASWEGAVSISTEINPDGEGAGSASITGGGTTNIEPGMTRTITATANTGWRFTHWTTTSGTITNSTDISTTFTVGTTNATITAHFEHHTYTVTLNPAPGTGGTLSFTHRVGTTPSAITPPTRTNWDFVGYYLGSVRIFNENGNPTSAAIDWVISGAQTLTAEWSEIFNSNIATEISDLGAGSVSVTGGGTTNLTPGTERTITATANTGWRFTHWTTTSGTITNSTDISTTFTIGESNAVITAHFVHHEYLVTLNPSPGTGGTTSFTHRVGQTPSAITPPTRTNWDFVGYYLGSVRIFNADGTPTSAATNWVISGAQTLIAEWDEILSNITTEVNETGAGSVNVTGTTTNLAPNTSRTITASANIGWRFTHWTTTSGTIANSTDISTTFTIGIVDAAITAHFEHHTYLVTLNPAPGTGGTLSFTHRVGTTPSAITPPTRNGWNFMGYYLGSTRVFNANGTPAVTDWVIAGTQTLIAEWEQIIIISTPLTPPTNLSVTNETAILTWDAVENATGYRLTFTSGSLSITRYTQTNSFNLATIRGFLEEHGSVSITIVALGDGSNFLNSDPSIALHILDTSVIDFGRTPNRILWWVAAGIAFGSGLSLILFIVLIKRGKRKDNAA